MKKTVLKGHPLTDDAMKEVCGGTLDIRTTKPEANEEGYSECSECGAPVKYEEIDGLYLAFCEKCGSRITTI